MLFKFIESDKGNALDSVATIAVARPDGSTGAGEYKVSLTLLVESCAKLPGFRGFLPGQLFEIDVRPVAIKPPDAEPAVRPVTTGRELLAV